MALIKQNKQIAKNIFLMDVSYDGKIFPGQFFMLRAWDVDPLLPRPISVHDYHDGVVSFLYQVVGKGTRILSELEAGDDVSLVGPLGNGFPDVPGDIVLVGGGIGTAPLYYLLRDHKAKYPDSHVRVYLGFSDESYGAERFSELADDVIVDIGGFITDKVEVKARDTVLACGPDVMLRALSQVVPKENPLYLSLEARMACGLGVCLGCNIETPEGNRKVCKDGPVFRREELGL